MADTPTTRTLKELRSHGFIVAKAEYWQAAKFRPGGGVRIDLFGFIDLVALCGSHGIVGIQATSGSNITSRIRKILTECREPAMAWLEAGGKIEVWGWKKKKVKVNGRNWVPDIRLIKIEDFKDVTR